jgi:very-short-patch-repair endonuclease
MGGQIHQSAWKLARHQHGVISRYQLLGLGFTSKAIEHRLAAGRLHPVRQGVYAVGRPQLTCHGLWTAAVLACGEGAVLSHETAGRLYGIRDGSSKIEISIARSVALRRSGILVHRRADLRPEDVTHRDHIPVTTVVATLVDLAPRLPEPELEAAINEADRLDLVTPPQLRAALDRMPRRPGIGILRELLDRRTFTLTDSELERRFLPLAAKAGLRSPLTRQVVNDYRVDFLWPDLGLIVETDGLRYHRTPAQQARDRIRDHAHTAAGLTQLRFTYSQVVFESDHVVTTLAAMAQRLMCGRLRTRGKVERSRHEERRRRSRGGGSAGD